MKANAKNLVIIATTFTQGAFFDVNDIPDDFDVDETDVNWRAQQNVFPGLNAIDVTIQQIREHFRRTKKTTGVALKNRVIGVSVGCKLLSVEGQEQINLP